MGRIVAISSGNLLTTRPLNKYAIKLSKKQNPRALFVGTESHDAQEYIHRRQKKSIRRKYIHTFTNEYEKLGCEVNANAFVLEYKNQMLKKTKVEFSVL